MQLIEKIQSFQAFLPGGEETFGAILMHKRIKFPTTDNWLGKGSQEQLDWSRQTLESTTRTLFQPLLSSSAATTNFGSRLLIELVREDTDWIGVGHCSKKLEIFFFSQGISPLSGQLWRTQTKWGVQNIYLYLFYWVHHLSSLMCWNQTKP